jgi:hypothetical protein
VIFNALIIIALVPLALRGVRYRPLGAEALLRWNLLVYGVGGIIAPFIGIKLIDMIITGYDASNSGGSNLGPTNKMLIDRVNGDVQKLQAENPNMPIPMDLITTSGSGLDPHISPDGAAFQAPRVAKERGMSESDVNALIAKHTEGRQLGFLGEPRVNVLELNLDLDLAHPMGK